MTRPFDPRRLQFYVTLPTPCPYLDGQQERKVFTQLDPLSGPQLNDYLTHSGVRRSQNVIYRPACETCSACKSLRVEAPDFTPGKSYRRILRKNAHLKREVCEPYATREQFDLLQRYLQFRHPDGGMSEMDFERYETMVEDCASASFIVEYRNENYVLIACVLIDELSDGLSMVYSFYAPDRAKNSLGVFMILDHLAICASQSLPYLYLGYWVPGSPKMDYKAQFTPAQILTRNGWSRLDPSAEVPIEPHFSIKDLQNL
jgi:arginine-tRNA-protein transferase